MEGTRERIEESFNDKKTDENTRSIPFYFIYFLGDDLGANQTAMLLGNEAVFPGGIRAVEGAASAA